MKYLVVTILVVLGSSLFAQGNFSTSVHKTRLGKNFWYGADTSVTGAPAPGFETLTNVPIDDPNLVCTLCHPGDNLDANGDPYPIPYPGADCKDCHATDTPPFPGPVTEDDCFGCHGRQKTEAVSLGYSDVHRDASTPFVCWDCHAKEELHGDDGTIYNSMLELGAILVDCEDAGCHSSLPSGHSAYDPPDHNGKIHCSSCHAQTVVSCYNCHFESQVQAGLKRAKQPIHDFVILVNREKDGKVYPATFQSLSYQGNTWAAFAPFSSHTITKTNARSCSDCHNNAVVQEYNSTGQIKFATWNSLDSTLSWKHGVVPMPLDYQSTFKMDFITYNGNPSDPVVSSKNWSYIGEDTWDGHQMFFATPLNKVQMAKIGFDTTLTSLDMGMINEIPSKFQLGQNYPNPFNPSTTIRFKLPLASTVTIRLFDIRGSEIQTLIANNHFPAGLHEIPFRADNLVSGVYIYQLTTSDFSAAKKMIVLR
jgi:hypothetical protein